VRGTRRAATSRSILVSRQTSLVQGSAKTDEKTHSSKDRGSVCYGCLSDLDITGEDPTQVRLGFATDLLHLRCRDTSCTADCQVVHEIRGVFTCEDRQHDGVVLYVIGAYDYHTAVLKGFGSRQDIVAHFDCRNWELW